MHLSKEEVLIDISQDKGFQCLLLLSPMLVYKHGISIIKTNIWENLRKDWKQQFVSFAFHIKILGRCIYLKGTLESMWKHVKLTIYLANKDSISYILLYLMNSKQQRLMTSSTSSTLPAGSQWECSLCKKIMWSSDYSQGLHSELFLVPILMRCVISLCAAIKFRCLVPTSETSLRSTDANSLSKAVVGSGEFKRI